MELHRARAARLAEEAHADELRRAGDAFERAGRARAELRALGVEARSSSLAHFAAPAAGVLPSRVGRAALRWLESGS